ncbi:MAG: HEAT repeat domain-containing protein, partial [Dehalococcoidia bacterium]
GAFRDAEAAGALAGVLAGDGDRSYYAQSNAAAALGKTLQPEAFEVLTGVLGRPAHNDVITAGALTGLGALRDERAVPVLLEHTRWGVNQNARRAATAALGALYPWLAAPDRVRVRERLEELLDDRWLRVQTSAAGALQAAGDPDAIPALHAAAARVLDGRMKRIARVAAAKIGEKAAKPEAMNALSKQVEELQQSNQKLADRLVALEERGVGRNARAGGRK